MPNAGNSSLTLLGLAVFGFALFAFNKRKRGNGELESNRQQITSIADDAGPSDQSRTSASEPPEWIPKHKIFLSHSGVQKAFTEHLCEKLEAVQHFPFFDKRSDSLRKGERFYPPLMKAAGECLVAILVLSEEFFTKSKWPMMELNEFVKAQESSNERLRILPLFLKITRQEFNRKRKGKAWVATWKSFADSNETINLSEWQDALSKVPANNGIEYGGETEGEAEFIKKVVAAVCKLVPADVKWDTSHVQSREALCEPIVNKLKGVEVLNKYKVRVVGLHGVGGVGKTTISKAVCNEMFGDFAGKVCHVELGGTNLKELMKTVLRELTEAGSEILDKDDDHDKLTYLLKERMRRQKVFLVLDNIWDNQIEEAEKYLNAGYHDGSMVLLTSRSREVLENQLRIPSCHCMEMPDLDEKGAIDFFLHFTKRSREVSEGSDKWKIVERCVKECYFLKDGRKGSGGSVEGGYHYHPLALKVLGGQLGSKSFEVWEESLSKLGGDRFNMRKDRIHPVFSILRIGFDKLGTEEQNIFLDLALVWVSKWRSWVQKFEWEWLCIIHRKNEVEMKEIVNALYRNGLLENVIGIEKLDYNIHDLFVEFAEAEARRGEFQARRFLLDKGQSEVPHELVEEPGGSCWPSLRRLIIHGNGARSLKGANLHYCKNVEVLNLGWCEELEEVDVGGMLNLRCIVITHCQKLRILVGLGKLINLVILQLASNNNLMELADDLGGLKQLQFFDLHECRNLRSLVGIAHAAALQKLNASGCGKLVKLPDDFSGLKQLQFLDLHWCWNLRSLVGIAHATALQKLNASGCGKLVKLPDDFSGLKQLQFLDLHGCWNLRSLVGIAHATALQELNASGCENLVELPDDFSGLKQLQFLDLHGCRNLRSLVGIAHATALQKLIASWCENLVGLPYDFSGLKQMHFLDLHGCKNLGSLVGIAHATALQKLNASGCENLVRLPDDFSGLKQLQFLDLHGCRNLRSLVGIAHAAALQELNASGCENLVELPDDFSGLKQLQFLDLLGCRNLRSLVGIAHATALQKLNASGCEKLVELPDDFSGLKQLQFLDLLGCRNLRSLVGIAHASALQKLSASGCEKLVELPDDFSGLKQLQFLDLRGCKNLRSLVGIAHAAALQKLNAYGCEKLVELPDDFSGLKQLEFLDLRGCKNLRSLVGIAHATALPELMASGCENLVEMPDDFSGLKQLEFLYLRGCKNLRSLVGIAHAAALEKLNASGCEKLVKLPDDFSGLKQLQFLDVSCCKSLRSLVGIAHATALRKLNASGCEELVELADDLSGLKQLRFLDLRGCKNLRSLVGIAHAAALQELNSSGCVNLVELPDDFSGLKQLQFLDLHGCRNLRILVGIAHATALQKLIASWCENLVGLPDDFSGLKQLQFLDLRGCKNLGSLVGIAHAASLQELNASGCGKLVELPDGLSGLKQLRFLDVSECKNLRSLVGIAHATALQKLNASGCENLVELPDDFSGLKQLQFLDLHGCRNLRSVVGIAHATALQELNSSGCLKLVELPDDFSGLKQLQFLDVSCCKSLRSLVGIAHATALRKLNASGCEELVELADDLSGLKQLRFLDVSWCKNLRSLLGIAHATSLLELMASGCENLVELPDCLSGLKQLQFLDLHGCRNLRSLVGIAHPLFHVGSTRCSAIKMEPIVQVSEAIQIIDNVDLISNPVRWNKHQCERIVSRFNAIRERLKSMGWNTAVGEAVDGGPVYVQLIKILKKGAALISDYGKGITSTIVSRTVNREAFQEIHENLDIVEESLGFQDLKGDFELRTGMDLNLLKGDAEADRKEMLNLWSQMQTAAVMDLQLEKLAQVVSEKLVRDSSGRRKDAGAASSALPSYLTIDQKSEIEIDQVQRVREYKRMSDQDPEEQVGWASVRSGRWLGCDFAIKVFKCGSDAIRAQWNESQLLMEVSKLVELQHPHVVRLVGFGQDEEECVFVMELMEGDLRQFMKTKRAKRDRPFEESEELDIISQIAKGMYFMHTKGYAHGDLKCSNILVNKVGEHLEVKISDLRGSQSLDKDWDSKAFEQASSTRRPRWTAPEAIDRYGWIPEAIDQSGWVPPFGELLKQSDVYSFAMTCYEIVTGRYPFDGIRGDELLQRIKEGASTSNPFPWGLDEGLKGLISSCWDKDPNKRPTFKMVCDNLDTIRSKKFGDVRNKSCEGMLTRIISQIRVSLSLGGDKRCSDSEPVFLRSDSFTVASELRYTNIPPDQLERKVFIGEGADGSVYKATWLGCTVAVKLLKSKLITRDLQQEVEFLIKVSRHPCIAQMIGLSKSSDGNLSIVMEYMDGNLRELISSRLTNLGAESRKSQPFAFHEEVLIITKIAWGMAYLHSRGLVHRDLNPSNVLAQDYTRTVDVKIVDFGRSYLSKCSSSNVSVDYYTGAGSGYYRAPEMLPWKGEDLPEALPKNSSKANLNALKATDVYSFAMICYEILTGKFLCLDLMLKEDPMIPITKGYRPKWPSDPRPELKLLIELVEKCWCMDPKERPTFLEICTDLENIFNNSFQVQPSIDQ